jgi:lipopolysaccharide/colanic/teichoic acid biosynthesis glycosyltransferase
MQFCVMPNQLKVERLTYLTAGLGHKESSTKSLRASGATRYDFFKSVIEFALALFLTILAAPIILFTALLVKLTSPGPAFYCQTRLGRNGRPYTIFKLRTMLHDCEKLSGPCWSAAGDPRITPLGLFLRRSHLDELPQLWNVLRGDMSLVGPRPERPEFFPRLEENLPLYRSRLVVRPGVTGLAQVQLPPDTDLASVRRKLAYDLYYLRSCSLWLDFKIFAATALHVVGVPYSFLGKTVSLPSDNTVEAAYRELTLENGALSHLDLCLPEGSAIVPNIEMVRA